MAEDLTELEARLFEWIRQSDFDSMPWSTANAAKAFKVKKDEIYEAVAALTRKSRTESKYSTKMVRSISLQSNYFSSCAFLCSFIAASLGSKTVHHLGLLKSLSSVTYDLIIIEMTSMITTTTKIIIKKAITLS